MNTDKPRISRKSKLQKTPSELKKTKKNWKHEIQTVASYLRGYHVRSAGAPKYVFFSTTQLLLNAVTGDRLIEMTKWDLFGRFLSIVFSVLQRSVQPVAVPGTLRSTVVGALAQ